MYVIVVGARSIDTKYYEDKKKKKKKKKEKTNNTDEEYAKTIDSETASKQKKRCTRSLSYQILKRICLEHSTTAS